MQLTDPQRRTLQLLIGTGDRPMFPADLAQRPRDRIEAPARSLDLPETLRLGERRRELSPATELSVRAELLGGALVVSGKLDLLLGAPDRLEPMRATRIAIDLKTGGAYPQYAEDNRLYALVLALRFGVPP